MIAGARFACIAVAAVAVGTADARGDQQAVNTIDTIFVVPGSHLDIGYTDLPSRVRETRVRHIDDAIAAALRDSTFVWFEEGGWSFDAWLRRHAHEANRLTAVRRLLRRGQLGVGATWLSPHAAPFPDALRFLTLHIAELTRLLDYRPSVAVLNDPPSYPEALADALANAGIRYLLIGANMLFARPLAAGLARSPFWWETARGNRLLVYIDPDGFTAGFDRWGLGPGCARFFNGDRFPRDSSDFATMRRGIAAGVVGLDTTFHAAIVQQALDNWATNCARELPSATRAWNDRGAVPRLVIAQPEAYFRHIEDRYGARLPVRRGEWGGQWDEIRASSPVWTWRLREAARRLPDDAPREARAAIVTALDHNLWLGPAGENRSAAQCRRSIQETADIYRRAVTLGWSADASAASPPDSALGNAPVSATWSSVQPPEMPVRLRAGQQPMGFAPFVRGDAPALDVPVATADQGGRIAVRATVDRRTLPEGNLVIELALNGGPGEYRLANAASPDAIAGQWLAGAPALTLAPDSVRVIGRRFSLEVTSPTIFAWALVGDPRRADITWLQGLVARQDVACALPGNRRVLLPFEDLHPGEPADLVIRLQVSLRQ